MLFLFIGILLLVVGAMILTADRKNKKNRTYRSVGTITRCEERDVPSSPDGKTERVYSPVVSYEVKNETYEVVSGKTFLKADDIRLGETVHLVVDPNNPTDFALDERGGDIFAWAAIVLGVAAAVFGLFHL